MTMSHLSSATSLETLLFDGIASFSKSTTRGLESALGELGSLKTLRFPESIEITKEMVGTVAQLTELRALDMWPMWSVKVDVPSKGKPKELWHASSCLQRIASLIITQIVRLALECRDGQQKRLIMQHDAIVCTRLTNLLLPAEILWDRQLPRAWSPLSAHKAHSLAAGAF